MQEPSPFTSSSNGSRLDALVSNTPGLVYQFQTDAQHHVSFPYLSQRCFALLGLDIDTLQANPSLFFELIVEEDRPAYLQSMQKSMQQQSTWNWEGRILVPGWNDIKWINLRATPRLLAAGMVQWTGIMTNITASKLEREEIIRSRKQLAELSAHIDLIKEQERTRISREIHDNLGGNLTAIKMALSLLTRRLPQDSAELMEKARYVDQLLDRTIETTHKIAGDLRPGVLDLGLVAALTWQAREFEKQTGLPCHVVSNKENIDLDPDLATALFRICQEALTNIAKHAQASKVEITLSHTPENIQLEIMDNGCGMATHPEKPASFGIRGMSERTKSLGGKLFFRSPPNGGTMIAIHIPLPLKESSHNRKDTTEKP